MNKRILGLAWKWALDLTLWGLALWFFVQLVLSLAREAPQP